MPKPDPKILLREATSYLKQHPEEILRIVRGAFGLRVGVPMDALRYLLREFTGGAKAPKDILIDASPPGVRIALTVEVMATPIRVGCTIFVEELNIISSEIRLGLRIEGLTLEVLADASSPIAGLIKSGVLDLSKPGNLAALMPKRPASVVDAKDDRIVLDLMKIPAIADNPKVKQVLAVATPVVGVRAIKTKDDHLDFYLKTDLSGVPAAIAAARAGVW
jgi:hypothetical protein